MIKMSTQILIFKHVVFLFLKKKKKVDKENNNNCCQIFHFFLRLSN